MKTKSTLIFIIVFAIFILGLKLLISPAIERRNALDKQNELLDSIIEGSGKFVIDESIASLILDYYDEIGDSVILKNEAGNEGLYTEVEVIIVPLPVPEPEQLYIPLGEAEFAEIIEIVEELERSVFPIPIASEPIAQPELTEPLSPIANTEIPNTVTGIGILTIDKIWLRLPVVEGVSENGLKIAVGHVTQTAVIGNIGNAVIAGHRSYTSGHMFNRLDELEIGDIIGYEAINGETMQFMVFEIAEIYPDDQIAFIQPIDESIITLYTCTPIRVASHRLLVRAVKL